MDKFIIIRYKIEMPFGNFGVCWQYAEVTVKGDTAHVKDIDREVALSIIEEYDMTLAHSDRNGKIWDRNGDFKKTFEGSINKYNYDYRRTKGWDADGDR